MGASNDRSKYGNKAVRAYQAKGFKVYPVNLREAQIEGLTAYATVQELPERPEWISVYLPPPVVLSLLPSIAEVGCDELWLNPGSESPEVLAEAERLGLTVVVACSIVGVGMRPAEL